MDKLEQETLTLKVETTKPTIKPQQGVDKGSAEAGDASKKKLEQRPKIVNVINRFYWSCHLQVTELKHGLEAIVKWRARDDSNVRPPPSEGGTLSS